MGGFEIVVVILLVCIGVLYWKAIQQVLRFRKDRKWTGKFVISAAWLGLVSFNLMISIFSWLT
jgi:hypothetical protein